MAVLPTSFFARDPTSVARDLVGMLLFRRSREGLTTGRIVETEAYLAEGDSAAHSYHGRNRKNSSMFGPPGHAYVYTIHARQCVNVVTEVEGIGSAVLIRAVEPLAGKELMRRRRNTERPRDLCRGPARLCEAFDIGRNFDGWPLTTKRRLWIAEDEASEGVAIAQSTRIGVTSAEDLRLRFFAPNNTFVSGPQWLNQGGADRQRTRGGS